MSRSRHLFWRRDEAAKSGIRLLADTARWPNLRFYLDRALIELAGSTHGKFFLDVQVHEGCPYSRAGASATPVLDATQTTNDHYSIRYDKYTWLLVSSKNSAWPMMLTDTWLFGSPIHGRHSSARSVDCDGVSLLLIALALAPIIRAGRAFAGAVLIHSSSNALQESNVAWEACLESVVQPTARTFILLDVWVSLKTASLGCHLR
jgi:hypothetical protein